MLVPLNNKGKKRPLSEQEKNRQRKEKERADYNRRNSDKWKR